MNKPRLLSDNGSSYVAGELAEWLGDKNIGARQGGTVSSANTGQDRAMAPDTEKPHPAGELLLPGRPGGTD